MKRKEKACSGAGTLGQAAEKENTAQNLHLHHITFDGPLSSVLDYGSDNGRKARELEQLTGLCAREINEVADQERRQGVPILADTKNGYYLPERNEEVVAFIRVMRHRAFEILKTAAAVERGIARSDAGE